MSQAGEKRYRVGVAGISGYGGGEALRYLLNHPHFTLNYAAGESSAGKRVGALFPGLSLDHAAAGDVVVTPFDPSATGDLDVLFASLPTGASKTPLADVPAHVKVVDIGGDHRYAADAPGWVYGLSDVWPDDVRGADRVANPGCFPAATLAALAPLFATGLADADATLIVDAKTGVSGAGRGGSASADFGYADVNESLHAYGLLKHAHLPEMRATLARWGNRDVPLVFTPHLVPMTRGILATCYVRTGTHTPQDVSHAAGAFYANRPFVRITQTPPRTKWASGSNLVYLHYATDPAAGVTVALAAIDNLGKGAAGGAVQNANLMLGLTETAGLTLPPLRP